MGKVLEFRRPEVKTRIIRPESKDDWETRVARIRTSLEKINRLMAELRVMAKDPKGAVNDTALP